MLVGVLLGQCLLAAESKSQKTEKSLKQINSEIQSLNEKDIKLDRKVSKLQRKLRNSDKELSRAGRSAQKSRKLLDQQQAKLDQLQKEKEETLRSIDDQKRSIREINTSLQKIQIGLKNHPLDSSSIGERQRLEYWLKHLNDENRSLLSRLAASNQQLSETESQLEQEISGLEETKKKHESRLAELKKLRSSQQAIVKSINKQKKKNSNKKEQLVKDQARLKTLLEKLKFAERHPEFVQEGKVAFHKLKGKLPWPIKGTIKKSRFSNGVSLQAKAGTKVRAITHGRVVFADWMKGFGLLVVVDHGDGYMSLYGQTETLYTNVGDWVEPGTLIASSGQSRGETPSGIYFEIRKKTKALNPLKWCK